MIYILTCLIGVGGLGGVSLCKTDKSCTSHTGFSEQWLKDWKLESAVIVGLLLEPELNLISGTLLNRLLSLYMDCVVSGKMQDEDLCNNQLLLGILQGL